MNPLVTFRVATRSLLRNKARSCLTSLGIIIGVGAVIAMVALGEGAKAQVMKTFASIGTNLLIVMSGSTSDKGARGGSGSKYTLTWDDLRAIQNEVPTVRRAAPVLRDGNQVIAEGQNWSTQVWGTSPEYFEIRHWRVERGVNISQAEVEGSLAVAVLGQTVVEKLFGPGVDPIGQIIRIKKAPFQVIGVLEKKGQSPSGQDSDDGVYLPYTTFASKIETAGAKYMNGIVFASATSFEDTDRAASQITNLLRDRHHIARGEDDDFFVQTVNDMANAREEGIQTLTTLLASIALVSLIVGGIGIMNIMLVSVTERTREIGVRIAVGAKARNILAQFLIEALCLAVAGGLIGVMSGVVTSRWLTAKFGWPTLISPEIVLISVCFAGFVGVVFGLYPAYKASRLDPIDALRYE
jgi:putative ABC transport system permease protein